MKRFFARVIISCFTLAFCLHAAAQEAKAPEKAVVKKARELLQIPSLNWEKRSDWISVKDFGAIGDGVADDTQVIQAMLDCLTDSNDMLRNARSRIVYFPPGKYRVTKTLVIKNSTGAYLVGHGRDTVLLWDGEEFGNLIWSNGSQYARYEGFVFDANNKASIGVMHHSMSYYETSLRYQHCEFRNFLDGGVVVGKGMGKDGKEDAKSQSAEIWFNNCLFRNCGTGASFLQFNDYDNFFDGCYFVDCGIGVNSTRGNFAVRNCNFERSKEVDVRQASPSHACAIRWSTSRGSKRFFDTGVGMHQSFTAQDCRIDGWTGTDGAFFLGHRGPSTIFDCVFTNPPDDQPPIRLKNRENTQAQLIVSNNISEATKSVVEPGPDSKITEIPNGKLSSCLKDANQTFFRTKAKIPGKVFDAVKDFNAKGDGSADDSDAIQNCINAAKANGKGAIAYLPGGSYKITKSLVVDGSDYYRGSSGFCSYLQWAGPDKGVMMTVSDPQNVTIEHISMYQAPKSVVQIRQTSKGGASSVYYDGLYVGACGPNGPGVELVDLPEKASVRFGHLIGTLRIIDCGRANITCNIHYYELTIEGAKFPKTGLTSFLFHNDAVHGYALTVKDNQDVVVGDFYSESNKQYLLCEGGKRSGKGRVTIGAQKISTLEAESVTIRDYEGRIYIGGGDAWVQSNMNEQMKFSHSGNRPLTFIVAGCGFWMFEPAIKLGKGARLVSIGNIITSNNYPDVGKKSLPVQLPEGAMEEVSGALDHFRQLGALNIKMNYE